MADRRAVVAERRLRLLGTWRLDVDGVEVRLGGREQRLASVLALLGRRARLQVAGTLWPESTDTRALASLRRALLLTQQRSPGLLCADRSSIGLDPSVQVDVDELRAAIDAAGRDPDPGEARTLLASLSSGELLPGWYDDWLIPEREQLAQSRVRALVRISRRALEEQDLLLAVDAAQVASATEPLLEAAREVAISAHLGRGDTGSALREFASYRDLLRDELDVAPSTSIVALVEHLVPGDRGRADPGGPTSVTRLDVPRPRAPIVTPAVTRRTPAPPTLPAPKAAPAWTGPPLQPAAEPVTEPMTSGTRAALARILALAAAMLVVAAWLAGLGLERGPGVVDRGDSGPARAASSADGPLAAPARRKVLVSSGDTPSGGVRFLVRATRRPTEVRLVMHGPAGTDVVRSVVVRRREGHRLVLGGLDPGTYTWAATSASAPRVSGRVTVAPAEVTVAAGPTSTAPPTPAATPAAAAAAAGSAPVTPSAPVSPSPTAASPTQQPSPSHEPKPSGRPTDPGTQPPTPVG